MNGKWFGRIGAIAGVAFGALLFLSVTEAEPLRQATDGDLTDWWASDSNRATLWISMYFRVLCVPFFLTFLVVLRSRLRAAERPQGWSDLVYSLGMLSAIAIAISAIGRGALAQAINLQDEPVPGVDLLRYVVEDSIGLFGIIGIPAGCLMVGVASLSSLQTKAFPAWLAAFGLIVVVIDIALMPVLLGQFATPLLSLWCFGASYHLFKGSKHSIAETTFVEAQATAG